MTKPNPPIESVHVVRIVNGVPTISDPIGISELLSYYSDDQYDSGVAFTDKESAVSYMTRQKLLINASDQLGHLPNDQLAEIAKAISPENIDDTIDSLNRYTD